jgi:hypothetical protein
MTKTTTRVKVVECKIADQYGLQVPKALVAILGSSKTYQETDTAIDENDFYTRELNIEGMTFRARFWYSEQTKMDGFRSRALIHDNNGVFTDIFKIDLEQQSAKDIIANDMEQEDKFFALIQNEITRRFN